MFNPPPDFIRKSALGSLVAIFGVFASLTSAAEPITNLVKKSESISTGITKQPSKFFPAYRPGDTISGSDIFKPDAPTVLPNPAPHPSSNKRDDDLRDRQKNWIFLSRNEKKPDATKEALGVKDISLEERKSVVTRFLENKPEADLRTNADEKNEINSSLNSQPLTSGSVAGVNNLTQKDPRRNGSLQPQPLDREYAGPATDRARFADLWQERFTVNPKEAREEKEAETKAFLNMFNSRSTAPVSGGITSLSGQNIFGVQLVTPGENGSSSAASPNSFTPSLDPFKEAPRRPVGGFSVLTEPSFSSRAFGPTVAPVLKQEAPKSVSQPAVLPFPKRHF